MRLQCDLRFGEAMSAPATIPHITPVTLFPQVQYMLHSLDPRHLGTLYIPRYIWNSFPNIGLCCVPINLGSSDDLYYEFATFS